MTVAYIYISQHMSLSMWGPLGDQWLGSAHVRCVYKQWAHNTNKS